MGGCSHDVSWANLNTFPDFRACCVEKLEKLGDIARDSKKHDDAIEYYSNALLLNPMNNDILLKRSMEVWSGFNVTSNGPH